MEVRVGIAVSLVVLLSGCAAASGPDLSRDDQVAERRAVQSRSFAGRGRVDVMRAAAHALRDLGFTVEEVDDEMGLLSASTERGISEPGNAALEFGVLMLIGLDLDMPEREQLSVSLVVSGRDDRAVYVSCERRVWTQAGFVMGSETGRVEQPEFYERLFDAMSTALFLEDEL